MEAYFRQQTKLSRLGRYGHFIALWVMVGATVAGCGSDKERIVAEKVAERVAEFRKRETEKCHQTLLAEAEHLVDSLLLAEAISEVSDSLRNRTPPRPVKPPVLPPWDSSPVRPIFDTTRQ